MATYIHQLPSWPKFTWDQHSLAVQLAAVRHRQGRLIGRMQALGFALRAEAVLQTLTEDVLKSSEIEGEILDQTEVRSSMARRLGIEAAALAPADRHVEGVVEMMLDATQKFRDQLTKERLFNWHASLFPTGRSGTRKVIVGAWRDDGSGPMQVVSGIEGRERVHYEAPAAAQPRRRKYSPFSAGSTIGTIPIQFSKRLWRICGSSPSIRSTMATGASHARSPICPWRDRKTPRSASTACPPKSGWSANTYYDMLESTQKGDLDVTPWMEWFLGCLDRAFDGAEKTLAIVFRKAEFWKRHSTTPFNERQRDIVNRLLDGFDGNLTSSKWATIEKCSADTALRDITDLLQRGLLKKNEGGGRSTSYSLAEGPGE